MGKPLGLTRRQVARQQYREEHESRCAACGGLAKDGNPLRDCHHGPECAFYDGEETCTCGRADYLVHAAGCPPSP